MKLKRLLFCLVLASPAMYAQEAPRDGAEPPFDAQRLFTTAPQREHLDALREGASPPARQIDDRREEVVPPQEQPQAKKPPRVALQGFIRRNDGRSAVWANGGNTLNGEAIRGDIRIDSGRLDGATVVIRLPDGRKLRLQPGQVWDPESGRVHEYLTNAQEPREGEESDPADP
ncbi:MAG: hypothetical protein WD382_06450 [Halofilum sp. (in: g-proteobacteria)]